LKFRDTLYQWYELHRRTLPWRETDDAYRIWISEIVLQQTRVIQGLGYYERLIASYPDVFSLAAASEDDVYKHWEGLGYYNRAALMLKTAREIANNYNGVFPTTSAELIRLKGIGEYTAAAIASFAFGEAVMCVDGNVKRLISRYFGIESLYGSSRFETEVCTSLSAVFDKENPALFNQAIMEFGALQCKPKAVCPTCPFLNECFANMHGKQNSIPVKPIKKTVATRYFNYFVVLSDDMKTLIKKRTADDIWKNMFEFPMTETIGPISDKILLPTDIKAVCKSTQASLLFEAAIHKLTHQQIAARFYVIRTSVVLPIRKKTDLLLVDSVDLEQYAMPRIITKYLPQIRESIFI